MTGYYPPCPNCHRCEKCRGDGTVTIVKLERRGDGTEVRVELRDTCPACRGVGGRVGGRHAQPPMTTSGSGFAGLRRHGTPTSDGVRQRSFLRTEPGKEESERWRSSGEANNGKDCQGPVHLFRILRAERGTTAIKSWLKASRVPYHQDFAHRKGTMVDDHAAKAPFVARAPTDRDVPRYSFFVSFEGSQATNAQWVAEVLKGLEPEHRTYFYPIDNHASADFEDRMDVAAEADHFIAILSDKYFRRTGKAYAELKVALGRDRSGDERHLLWVSFEPEIAAYSSIKSRVGLPLYEVSFEDRADALLDFVHSAQTGEAFGYTPGVRLLDEIGEFDTGVEPHAAWIPPTWNPRGTAPLPTREDHFLRLDALWSRDPSPFRAVLADRPGAALTATLRTSVVHEPGHRSWHLLRSLTGRETPYRDRADVLAALDPPVTGDDLASPVGIVTGVPLNSSAGLAPVVERAVEGFLRLEALLPDDVLVLRLQHGPAAAPAWAAALVARRLRDHGLVVDAATRARDTVPPAPGGVTDRALEVLLGVIRQRRQSLGADTRFTARAADAKVGTDTATALVAALEAGGTLPDGLTEADFLRHLRDVVPELWESLVRRYAAERTGSGWYVGLGVVAEWSADLAVWIEVAADRAESPLHRPEHLLGRLDQAGIERVLLGLSGRRELQARWASATGSEPVFEGCSWDRRPADSIRRMLRHQDLAAPLTPAHPAYWVALACTPTVDQALMTSLGITPAEVLSARPPTVTDPGRAQRLDYYRHLVRPDGAAS